MMPTYIETIMPKNNEPHTEKTPLSQRVDTEKTSNLAFEEQEALSRPLITDTMVKREVKGNSYLKIAVFVLLALTVVLAVTIGAYFARSAATSRVNEGNTTVTAQQYLRDHPDDSKAYENLARAQAAEGQLSAASKTIQDGVKKTQNGNLWFTMGNLFREAKEYSQAVAAYDKAEAARLESLGVDKGDSGKQESSEAQNTTLPQDQILGEIYLGRALSEMAIGNKDAAEKDFEDSVACYPFSATTWTTLGDFYLANGEKDKAKEAYKEALVYVPDYQPAKQGLKRAGGDK